MRGGVGGGVGEGVGGREGGLAGSSEDGDAIEALANKGADGTVRRGGRKRAGAMGGPKESAARGCLPLSLEAPGS